MNMARRKTAAKKTRTRTVTVTKTRKVNAMNPRKAMLSGAIYGAGRGALSSAIAPVTSRLPLGQYADEAGMLGLSYFAAKGKFGAQFKQIGMAGLHIESAVIGNALVRGGLNQVGIKRPAGGGF
jgi:hypothetical protein